MSLFSRLLLHARFHPLFTLLLWYLGLSALTRFILWYEFGQQAQVAGFALAWIMPVGVFNDLIESFYLLLPFALFLWLWPERWYRAAWMRATVIAGACIWMFGLLFIAACEYFFFAEFDARFNLVSVDYLLYPTEVAGDIWTEYPVVLILAAGAALALSLTYLLRRRLIAPPAPTTLMQRTRSISLYFGVLTLSMVTMNANSLGGSENRVANQLAANGPASFFHAFRTSDIAYPPYYATRSSSANLATLAAHLSRGTGQFTNLAQGSLERSFPARADGLGKLNIVLISSESFGAEFSKLYGSTRDWTPEFDRYAAAGLWFRHTYASGTRTVRGLEAITASIPPIPTDSIVRRPGNEDIATLGKVLRQHGYHTSFLYGGYSYFDNMKEFFTANGYTVIDRTDLKTPPRFENIWGVSDEDLFDMALEHADQLAVKGAPFFIHIMNTSNHKPFTFRTGLESIGVKAVGGGRESGVRYADYAQGYFLRAAAQHAWFADTLFIIVADHGARVYGWQEIPIKTYEILLLFYAPKYIHPQRVNGLTAQIDIAPTLMGLLGLPYSAPWFGQDVLHTPEQDRVAFFSHNHDVALYQDGVLSILGLQKKITNEAYDFSTDTYSDQSKNAALNDLAIAYYQTAYELFNARQYR